MNASLTTLSFFGMFWTFVSAQPLSAVQRIIGTRIIEDELLRDPETVFHHLQASVEFGLVEVDLLDTSAEDHDELLEVLEEDSELLLDETLYLLGRTTIQQHLNEPRVWI
jgi:hypothetical protein